MNTGTEDRVDWRGPRTVFELVLNESIDRDRAAADSVHQEIKTKGTFWAAEEIRRLRAALDRRAT